MNKRFGGGLVSFLLWGGMAWGAAESLTASASWEEVTAALQEHRYRRAAALLEPLARQGHAEAQFTLGVLYSRGTGVEMDERRAADWFEEAANQGHGEAQFRLGQFYQQGWGVPDSPSRANHWFQRCAAQGNVHCRLVTGDVETTVGTVKAEPVKLEPVKPDPVKPLEPTKLEPVNLEPVNLEPIKPLESAKVPISSVSPVPPLIPEWLDDRWLAEQDPSHYTLQLMSSLKAEDARNYARQQGLTGTLAVVTTRRQGRGLYCLIYGSYPTATAARKARDELPPEVAKTGSWVRRFRELQGMVEGAEAHIKPASNKN
mgnify:CR=1 FL=1